MKKRLFDVAVETITNRLLRTKAYYEVDVRSERAFIQSLPEPNNDYQRSYRQYQCQCSLRKKYATLFLNVVSVFTIPVYILFCLLKRKQYIKKVEAVYSISIKDKSIIPISLMEKYPESHITNEYDGFLITFSDLFFILRIFLHYPISPYFLLKNIVKISIYRYFITAYEPKIIAINSEFSCCSSIMTKYCEEKSIEHINIMHGEKLFYIRDSFFRFSKCFVWDEFYVELFRKLRATKNCFVVEKPKSLEINMEQLKGKIPLIDYKYMLFENTQLSGVANSLKVLKDMGYSVQVRPHPAYSNMDKINELFSSEDIEDCSIPIQTSVANSINVISLCSTVLYQSYLNGVDYIIDDVNYADEYNRIKDLEYILISKPHKNLSDVISNLKKSN